LHAPFAALLVKPRFRGKLWHSARAGPRWGHLRVPFWVCGWLWRRKP